MTIRCLACGKGFEPSPQQAGRSTATCPHCGRVAVIPDASSGAARSVAADDDPGTAPFLKDLSPSEGPTSIGVAGQLLRLPPGKRVSVTVLSGAQKGQVIALDRPRLTLGRIGGGADLEVADPDVSRNHAAVECHGPRVVLRDLGSHNGTFLDEQPITQRDIEDRSEFRLGGTTFLLLMTDA